MGTWGYGIFDSDAALDFVDAVRVRLGTGEDRAVIADLLARAAESVGALDAHQIFAAAELTAAAARGEPSACGLAFGWRATPDERRVALAALERAARESDFAYDWADAGVYARFVEPVVPLYRELGGGELSLEPPTPPPPAPVVEPPAPLVDWVCQGCGVYFDIRPDPTPFEALPETWTCEVCGGPRSGFVRHEWSPRARSR
jgi:rubredoxin